MKNHTDLVTSAAPTAAVARQHDQCVVDADFAELLRWLRLALARDLP